MHRKKTGEISIKALEQMTSQVSSDNELDQLLELIIETATKIMQARASSLLLVDQESGRLFFKVATGEKKDALKGFEIKAGQGIAGYVVETGEPLLIRDVNNDSRWYKKISESIEFRTKSIACVPMKIKDRTIGVIEIIDKINGETFQQDDIKKLTVFSSLAAMAIGNARTMAKIAKENKALKEELGLKYRIIGESRALKRVISDASKVARSSISTLLLGESGTGKELLARLIHKESSRKDKPMIILNCAALPEALLEDELFGHEKGAFTGALNKKIGKFELADQGTIFFDEIGEMHPGMQAKLLRVLQEGIFYRVGGNDPVSVDVRVLAATNRDIEEDVKEGKFREDLYYRLNVVQILIPALRERKEDILPIAEYYLDSFKKKRGLPNLTISGKAMEKIFQYDWPGNVRELCNALERAVVMGNGREIKESDLTISGAKPKYPGLQIGLTLEEALNHFKKEFITINLEHTGGVRSKAAVVMGIQRTYLSRLISKYDLRGI
ncbi:MAG: sigma 54-interacting transcriptional regulator [Deltaproteobacteria bacterium]|nr:sigma 54-interacting transcriptional regulator [Deltaproteobacteria bacterium]